MSRSYPGKNIRRKAVQAENRMYKGFEVRMGRRAMMKLRDQESGADSVSTELRAGGEQKKYC